MPIGNPAYPGLLEEGCCIPDTSWANLQCGFTADDLSQKRFFARRNSQDLQLHKARLYGVSQVGNVAWNILERCNVQFVLGSGHFYWIWRQAHNTAIAGQAADGLIWGGDVKVVIFEIQDTALALDGQAGGWDWMEGRANANGVPLKGKVACEMRYWRIAVALSQKIGRIFAPYLGFVANRERLKLRKLESGVGWLRAKDPIGLFLGCTLTQGSKVLLNVEWRGGFEQGLALSGQIRF